MRMPRGVGIGLRRDHFAAIVERTPERALSDVDFVEIIPENFVGKGGRARALLDDVRAARPVLAHGVSLSLGGTEPLDRAWLSSLGAFLDELDVPVFTEHLSFASAGGIAFHELLPLPFTDEAVRHVVARVREASDALGRHVLLENPSALGRLPGTLDEGTFTRAVLEESGAGLLLDVNNVYVTAMNTGTDPLALLASLPLDRVAQIHVAGHQRVMGFLVDTHVGPVPSDVCALLAVAAREAKDAPVLLEWDTQIPPLDDVLAEARRIRRVVEDARREPTGARASSARDTHAGAP